MEEKEQGERKVGGTKQVDRPKARIGRELLWTFFFYGGFWGPSRSASLVLPQRAAFLVSQPAHHRRRKGAHPNQTQGTGNTSQPIGPTHHSMADNNQLDMDGSS